MFSWVVVVVVAVVVDVFVLAQIKQNKKPKV